MNIAILREDEVTWAYKKWCHGYTFVEIGKALHVSAQTVCSAFQKRNLQKVKKPLVYRGEK